MTGKLKFSILFVAIAFLAPSFVFAQFTRNDTNNLVLNTILAGEIGNVDVYSSTNSKRIDFFNPPTPNYDIVLNIKRLQLFPKDMDIFCIFIG